MASFYLRFTSLQLQNFINHDPAKPLDLQENFHKLAAAYSCDDYKQVQSQYSKLAASVNTEKESEEDSANEKPTQKRTCEEVSASKPNKKPRKSDCS